MKLYSVVILDDEEWIVRGLAEMIDWEEYGFSVSGLYTDPEEALRKMRETEPDLLLLDIHMPKISGDIMMEMIREEGIPTEFILLSGYSDFSVLKKAELIAALQRVKKTFEERKERNLEIPIDPLNREAFFQHAWDNSTREVAAGKQYQLLLIDTDFPAKLPSVPGVMLSNPVHIYGGRILYMAVSNAGETVWAFYMEQLKAWSKGQGISLGMSRQGTSSNEYHNLFRQANCALCCAHLQNKTDCYLYTPPDMQEVSQWTQTLQQLYQSKDQAKLYWELSQLMDEWKIHGNPASVLMLIMQLTYMMMPENGMERKAEEINLEKFLYDDISSKFANVKEIFDYLLQLLNTEDLEEESIIQIPATVSKLKQYLYDHFSEELNLTRISREFYLTPSYLCDIFKKYTGCTITGYLLKIRMEKASGMLLNTNLSLVEIAAQVGYSDYNYFSRLFKRYFNISPNAFRKSKNQSSEFK